MSHKTRIRLLGVTALIAGIFFFWVERRLWPGNGRPEPPQKNIDLVESVVRLIRADYVEEPDPAGTMRGAFQGLVNSLDALSSFLDKAEAVKLADPERPRYNDLGLILYKKASTFPLVVGLIEGSPAEKAGILVGDVLSAMDDRSTILQGLQEVRLYAKDPAAKPVKLRLIRDLATKEITVTRGPLYARSYTFAEQAGTAGILTVHHFYPPLVDEITAGLAPKLAAARGLLILDLRGCFEGENEEARKFLNLFVRSDKAGYFEKKGGAKEPFLCDAAAPLAALQVALWIDQTTMGPAEIAAACLRDLKKAIAVGYQTPGLAARQDVFPLSGGDALLLTTGVFTLSSGEKIWGKGVTPDVKLEAAKPDSKAFLEKTLHPPARRP